ncbi:MAG TPA: hypothetical protein VGI11_15720 [Variovorax sp.]
MATTEVPHLDAAQLRALSERSPSAGCEVCRGLVCPGWEAMSPTFDEGCLQRVGTLKPADPDAQEPTLDEHHPGATHYWSKDAPIAPGHFPYNRCDVWACRRCARAFLRYTEYGGYYVEPRIRLLDSALVTQAGELGP